MACVDGLLVQNVICICICIIIAAFVLVFVLFLYQYLYYGCEVASVDGLLVQINVHWGLHRKGFLLRAQSTFQSVHNFVISPQIFSAELLQRRRLSNAPCIFQIIILLKLVNLIKMMIGAKFPQSCEI